jgi:hypothetical protein
MSQEQTTVVFNSSVFRETFYFSIARSFMCNNPSLENVFATCRRIATSTIVQWQFYFYLSFSNLFPFVALQFSSRCSIVRPIYCSLAAFPCDPNSWCWGSRTFDSTLYWLASLLLPAFCLNLPTRFDLMTFISSLAIANCTPTFVSPFQHLFHFDWFGGKHLSQRSLGS